MDESKTHTVEPFDLKDIPVQEEDKDIIEEITTLVEPKDKVDMSLQQCRAIALETNLDLKVALIDPTIINEAIIEQEAAFEPTLNLATGLTKTDTAVFSQLDSSQGETKYGRASLDIPLRTGGNIELAMGDYEQESNNSFTTINPVYYGDFQFSVSQPLLQGIGSPREKHRIRVARYDKQLADISSKVQVITVLRTIDDLYWDL